MLKNRLLAATAALALASSQVSPGFALSGAQIRQQNTSPVPNPDGYSAQQLLGMGAPSLGAGTTLGGDIAAGQSFVATAIANLQTYIIGLLGEKLSHVANAAALASWTNYAFPVHRDDVGIDYLDSGANCLAVDAGVQVLGPPGHCFIAQLKGVGPVSVNLWGSVADSNGTSGNGTDDTAAEQAAFNWSVATGRRVTHPASPTGLMRRTTAPLNLSGHAYIDGDYCAPYTVGGTLSPGAGSWLFFDHSGRGIVAGTGGGPNEGMVIADICTYRAQPAAPANTASGTAGGTWMPGNFDYDIVEAQDDLLIRHVMLLNPSKGLLQIAGRIRVDGLEGQPAQVGFMVTAALDTPNIANVHFWPFGADNAAIENYTVANLDAFVFQRADNAFLTNIFSILGRHCIHLSGNAQGTVNKMHGVNIDCDGTGQDGLYVDSLATGATFQFANFTTQSVGTSGSNVTTPSNVDIEANNVRGGIVGLRTTLAQNSAVTINGNASSLSLTNPELEIFGQAGPSAAIAINQTTSAVYVSGHAVLPGMAATNAMFSGIGLGYAVPMAALSPIAASSKLALAPGSGTIQVSDTAGGGGLATYLVLGGMVVLQSQIGTEFSAQTTGGSDATGAANAAANTVSLYYSSDTGLYTFYNKRTLNGTPIGVVLNVEQNNTRSAN